MNCYRTGEVCETNWDEYFGDGRSYKDRLVKGAGGSLTVKINVFLQQDITVLYGM